MLANARKWVVRPFASLLLPVAVSGLLLGCQDGRTGDDGSGNTGWPGTGGNNTNTDGGPTSDGSGTETSGTGTSDPSSGSSGTSGGTSGGGSSGGGSSGGGSSGGASTTGSDPTTTTTTGEGPEVPDNEYCAPYADWDPQWVQLEEEIVVLVNQYRAQGADCGSEGVFEPADPLTMEPHLRCAARLHSKDMNDRDFFSHTNPSGESPYDRMDQTGYRYSDAGENIAAGNPDAASTMNQWMNSSAHCRNIMDPVFRDIGVGFYPGAERELWTQTFGRS